MRAAPALVALLAAAAPCAPACTRAGGVADAEAMDAALAEDAGPGDAPQAGDVLLDAPPLPCAPGDPAPWWCVPSGAIGPVCGDVHFEPSCAGGVWACPFTSVPGPSRGCQCYRASSPIPQRCVCTDGGVACTSLIDTGPGP